MFVKFVIHTHTHTHTHIHVHKQIVNLITAKSQELLDSETLDSSSKTTFWTKIFEIASIKSIQSRPYMSMLRDIERLSVAYKEMVYGVKDSLLLPSFSKSSKQKSTTKQGKQPSNPKTSFTPQAMSNNSFSNAGIPLIQSGISLQNIEEVMESLSELTKRAEMMIAIIEGLGRLCSLQPMLVGLPRVTGVWVTETKRSGDKDIKKQGEMDRNEASNGVSTEIASTKKDGSTDSFYREEEDEDSGNISLPAVEYSDSREDSVAEMVRTYTTLIHGCLQSGCPLGTKEVFVTHGKDKGVFPQVYMEYCQLMSHIEENICKYLLVSYNLKSVHVHDDIM